MAIETSVRQGGVRAARFDAVTRREANAAVRELLSTAPLTSILLPTIRDTLAELGATARDVRVAGFSRGPGSFTGLRVAATVVRMLQSTLGCDVVGVPTHAGIAAGAFDWLASPDAADVRKCLTAAGDGTDAADESCVVVLTPAKRGFVFASGHCGRDRDAGRKALADSPPVRTKFDGEVEMLAVETCLQHFTPPFAVVVDAAVPINATDVAGVIQLPAQLAAPRVEVIARLTLAQFLDQRTLQPHEIVPLYVRKPECEEVYDARRAEARSRRGE